MSSQKTQNFNQLDGTYKIYKASIWNLISSDLSIIILFVFVCFLLVTDRGPLPEKSIVFFFMILSGGLLAYTFNRYLACSKQCIQISEVNNEFFYGSGLDEKKYDKCNIEKITIYQPGGVKKLHYFYVYEILFNDGLTLKFSSILMSEGKVLANFPNYLVRYDPKSPFWRL